MKTRTFISNHFYDFHPVSLLFYFSVLLFNILSATYNIFLVFAFISLILMIIQLEGIKSTTKTLLYFLFFTFLITTFTLIFNHSGKNVFLYINNVPLTLDSLIYGIYTGIMVSSLMLWFKIFNHSFDNGKITYIFSKYLPVTGLIISMSFSSYNRFRYKLDLIRQVLYTQNIRNSHSHILNKIKYGSTVFSLLVNVMLEDSLDSASSMLARGYGKHKKITYKKYTFEHNDLFLITISILYFLFTIIFDNIYILSILFILIPLLYNTYMYFLFLYFFNKESRSNDEFNKI